MERIFVVVSVSFILLLNGCGSVTKEKQLERFIETHIAKVEPLSTQANLAYWDASTTGKPEDYERVNKLQLKIRRVYNNPQEFVFLKDIKESGLVSNAKLARQLDKLYYAYLKSQIGQELLEKLVDSDSRIQETN